MNKLTEKLVRAYIKGFNDTTDKHVRMLTFEEVVKDPRYGIVYCTHEILKELKEFLVIRQPDGVTDIYNILDAAIKDGHWSK